MKAIYTCRKTHRQFPPMSERVNKYSTGWRIQLFCKTGFLIFILFSNHECKQSFDSGKSEIRTACFFFPPYNSYHKLKWPKWKRYMMPNTSTRRLSLVCVPQTFPLNSAKCLFALVIANLTVLRWTVSKVLFSCETKPSTFGRTLFHFCFFSCALRPYFGSTASPTPTPTLCCRSLLEYVDFC